MSHFKKKLFWVLLIPFVVIGILLLYNVPANQRAYVVALPLPFWIVYSILDKYFSKQMK